jgi:hypothetical protein
MAAGKAAMLVNGRDCSIVVKTAYREFGVLYSEETLREAVSILAEEAPIEGDGMCRAIRKNSGVTGCVITPLTIGTAPLLLHLAFGAAGLPVFVSETRNIYRCGLNLLPVEDCPRFDLIQDRGGERKLFEGCRVTGFELRIDREAAVKLKLDIRGECPPVVYPYLELAATGTEERFSGDYVTYRINGQEYTNIYGLTLSAKKRAGRKRSYGLRGL